MLTVSHLQTVKVDISLLLKAPDSNESPPSPPLPRTQQHSQLPSQPQQSRASPLPRNHHMRAASVPPPISSAGLRSFPPPGSTSVKRGMPQHIAESPAKKQSKWSADEDALIIDLRGGGMKWEDISKRLPGRSAISCRLHYQNYLERRSEWDEEKKNKLARLYERFKPEMWSKVAEEMAVPWRAAEAMHWQLGEADMARRAGVVPFALSTNSVDTQLPSEHPNLRHYPPPHGHSHANSHTGTPQATASYSNAPRYRGGPGGGPIGLGPGTMNMGPARTIAARKDSIPRSPPQPSPSQGFVLAGITGGGGMVGRGGNSFNPQQSMATQMLPSVAEMTTGMSPYSTPAYAAAPMPRGGGGGGGGYSSPGPLLPSLNVGTGYARTDTPPGMRTNQDGKRRASPDLVPRETSRRRQ